MKCSCEFSERAGPICIWNSPLLLCISKFWHARFKPMAVDIRLTITIPILPTLLPKPLRQLAVRPELPVGRISASLIVVHQSALCVFLHWRRTVLAETIGSLPSVHAFASRAVSGHATAHINHIF